MLSSLAAFVLIHDEPRFIDLTDDSARQVVVDKEAGQYLGHPTTVLLEDGKTILCVYPKGHGKGGVLYKRSEDGGKTWSERLPTPTNWETSQETPTLHRLVDPRSGKGRLIMWSGLYPARLATSEDDGANWSELKKAGDWGGIVVMGALEPISDGKYGAWFHDDGRFFAEGGKVTPTFNLYQTESSDGGLTWSQPHSIWSGSDLHLCEPGIVKSPDGKVMAMLLRENRRRQYSHILFSRDGAKSWSTPRPMNEFLTGDRHTAKYSQDGRLMISFRDMAQGSPFWGDWVAWVGTWEDLLQNRPGQYKVRLKDNLVNSDCAYPGVEILPDGNYVLTTYGHWEAEHSPYILSVRLSLADLDKRAAK